MLFLIFQWFVCYPVLHQVPPALLSIPDRSTSQIWQGFRSLHLVSKEAFANLMFLCACGLTVWQLLSTFGSITNNNSITDTTLNPPLIITNVRSFCLSDPWALALHGTKISLLIFWPEREIKPVSACWVGPHVPCRISFGASPEVWWWCTNSPGSWLATHVKLWLGASPKDHLFQLIFIYLFLSKIRALNIWECNTLLTWFFF